MTDVVAFPSVPLPATMSCPPAVICTRPGATAASEGANPVICTFNISPGRAGFVALIIAFVTLCTPLMDGGAGAIATTTGYAVVVPLFNRRIAGPGWSDAGTTRLI